MVAPLALAIGIGNAFAKHIVRVTVSNRPGRQPGWRLNGGMHDIIIGCYIFYTFKRTLVVSEIVCNCILEIGISRQYSFAIGR
jgi:hypothetical protein